MTLAWAVVLLALAVFFVACAGWDIASAIRKAPAPPSVLRMEGNHHPPDTSTAYAIRELAEVLRKPRVRWPADGPDPEAQWIAQAIKDAGCEIAHCVYHGLTKRDEEPV